ncbi:Fic family protein [Glutamicibacter sp. NPDC087344]|uniref:Fic family protein n=1 Tax=Glutamicibacter sp. NPDC087344 TaxID=3363994 RepID=UPI00381550B3
MAKNSRFNRRSDQYQKQHKPIVGNSASLLEPVLSPAPPRDMAREVATGISWDSTAIDWTLLQKSAPERVLARFKAVLPAHVWDAAALEGNTFTLPEVQTLLEGITVGGRRQDEAEQVLALAESSKALAHMVRHGKFVMDRPTINQIHHLVARFEALDAGMFRGEGPTRGGGLVNLGGQGEYQATSSADGGADLRKEFDSAIVYLSSAELHPAERAIAYFGIGAFRQFFFDGNKRTSRLMMNGWLMAQGYDAISIPAARRLELNQHLISMYTGKDATGLMNFIVDCRPRP